MADLVPDNRREGHVTDRQPTAPPRVTVGIVFSVPQEAGGVVDRLTDAKTLRGESITEHRGKLDQIHLAALESGAGSLRAAAATHDLIRNHQPEWVISAGFATALLPSMRRGQIVMPTQIRGGDAELSVGLLIDDQSLKSTPGLTTGRMLQQPAEDLTADDKRHIGEDANAVACDAVSFAIGEVCQQRKTKFLCVRVITETVKQRMSPHMRKLLHQPTLSAKLGAATGAIWNRPSTLKELWQIKSWQLRAADRLANFLQGVLGQLS
jgi:adenosylhomocysteine nucleosidase